MIPRFLKIYIFLAVLMSDFIMFADDDPGTGFEDQFGNTDGTVDDGVPINSKIVFLAIAAVTFAYYHFREQSKLTSEK